jgi:hypothetical protein
MYGVYGKRVRALRSYFCFYFYREEKGKESFMGRNCYDTLPYPAVAVEYGS